MFQLINLLVYYMWWVVASSRDNVIDNCDYNALPVPQTRCGDQCIACNRTCICGEERLSPSYDSQHCCVNPSPENITQCFIDDNYGICPQGRVLDKTEPCNGHCFNDYHGSEQIGYDSQFRCGNRCVPVWKITNDQPVQKKDVY